MLRGAGFEYSKHTRAGWGPSFDYSKRTWAGWGPARTPLGKRGCSAAAGLSAVSLLCVCLSAHWTDRTAPRVSRDFVSCDWGDQTSERCAGLRREAA